MKAFVNSKGEMQAFENGKPYSTDQPTLFPDNAANEGVFDGIEREGLELVPIKHEQSGAHFVFDAQGARAKESQSNQ